MFASKATVGVVIERVAVAVVGGGELRVGDAPDETSLRTHHCIGNVRKITKYRKIKNVTIHYDTISFEILGRCISI